MGSSAPLTVKSRPFAKTATSPTPFERKTDEEGVDRWLKFFESKPEEMLCPNPEEFFIAGIRIVPDK